MKKEFIRVNDAILDYEVYIKEVKWLLGHVSSRLCDVALQQGFVIIKCAEQNYAQTILIMINIEKDIIIELNIRKNNAEEFV
jgi:hypothetical protein